MDIIFDIEKDPVYKEGEKKGERLKAVTIARAMKQAGEPTEKIAAYTRLSADDIEKL